METVAEEEDRLWWAQPRHPCIPILNLGWGDSTEEGSERVRIRTLGSRLWSSLLSTMAVPVGTLTWKGSIPWAPTADMELQTANAYWEKKSWPHPGMSPFFCLSSPESSVPKWIPSHKQQKRLRRLYFYVYRACRHIHTYMCDTNDGEETWDSRVGSPGRGLREGSWQALEGDRRSKAILCHLKYFLKILNKNKKET